MLNKGNYETATGTIDFTLKNNYMFQLVLQNLDILKGLLCALLDLKPDEILEIQILNPVTLSGRFNAKEFVLDILILLNNKQRINIEMQVENENNWPNRSLSYLCRAFDNLVSGEDYNNVRAAIHISIVDFDVFPDEPEFYSDNRLMNVKTYKIYNDKFRLRVLSLKQINRATAEDKTAGRDKWAALFRAKTWEELKMAAATNPCMEAAAQKLYIANSDIVARERAFAVAEYERKERRMKEMAAREAELLEHQAQMEAQQAQMKAQQAQMEAQQAQMKAQQVQMEAQQAQMKLQLEAKDNALSEKERELALLRAELELLRSHQH